MRADRPLHRSRRPWRARLAVGLAALLLQGLALPALAALATAPAMDDCEHCATAVWQQPCLMTAADLATDDTAGPRPARAAPPVLPLRLRAGLPQPRRIDLAAAAGLQRVRGAALLAGRHTGDPPRHLGLCRLLN